MTDHESLNKALICIFLLTFTFGCTTTRSLTTTSPQALVDSIKVEDTVEIERIDGTSLKFEVTEVSKEGIRGSGIFVPYFEIQKISVIRESLVRTGLLVALGVTVLFALEKNADCGIFKWGEECDD